MDKRTTTKGCIFGIPAWPLFIQKNWIMNFFSLPKNPSTEEKFRQNPHPDHSFGPLGKLWMFLREFRMTKRRCQTCIFLASLLGRSKSLFLGEIDKTSKLNGPPCREAMMKLTSLHGWSINVYVHRIFLLPSLPGCLFLNSLGPPIHEPILSPNFGQGQLLPPEVRLGTAFARPSPFERGF